MTEPIIVNDDNLDDILNGSKPVLLLIGDNSNIRGDFKTAFKTAVEENPDYIIAQIDPKKNPIAAERFEIGSKAVMVAWACGEAKARRVRPWGTDVPLAIDMLKEFVNAPAPIETESTSEEANPIKEITTVVNQPLTVTDETFQTDVIDSDLPVLVDFWAEWCGPCRMVAPILDKMAEEFAGKIKIAKVNVDENPGLSQTFKIMSIPNMMAIKNRTMVFNQPGALPEESMRELIKQLIDLEVPDPELQEENTQTEEANGD